MLDFTWEDEAMRVCQALFNDLDPEKRLFMNHYDLAKETRLADTNAWKMFLTDPRVVEWFDSEMKLFKKQQLNKAIKNATDSSRSVGAAQMINALDKITDDADQKGGPVFVYGYIPLNAREESVPNVQIQTTDVFKRED